MNSVTPVKSLEIRKDKYLLKHHLSGEYFDGLEAQGIISKKKEEL